MAEEKEKTIESPDRNPGGRPTVCTSEIVNSARLYLENWKALDSTDIIPSIEGLAMYLGIARSTVYNWLNNKEKDKNKIEFLYILERIMQKQAKILMNKGLLAEFNSTITKLMMTKHGYVDKSENTSKQELDLTDEQRKKLDLLLEENNDKQGSPQKNDNGNAGREGISGK